MMKPVTTKLVAALVQARMESDVADDILAVLKLHEGELLTVRILPLLPGGAERWRITHSYMMTKIEERAAALRPRVLGISLLMAHATKNVTIDTSFVVAHNPADFAGRIERNKKRRFVLDKPALCQAMADYVNMVMEAERMLLQAKERLQYFTLESEETSFVGPDSKKGAGMFSSDRFAFEALAEGDEKKTKILLECHGIKEEAT